MKKIKNNFKRLRSKHVMTALLLCCSVFATAQNAFDAAKKHFAEHNAPLKVSAIEFLEQNVDIHYTHTYYYVDSLGNKVNFNELDFPNYNESRKALKALRLKPVAYDVQDSEVLTADDLINTVERGFEAWAKPWNKNLSFEDFCDYLLPYRVENEPFEADWYSLFNKKF